MTNHVPFPPTGRAGGVCREGWILQNVFLQCRRHFPPCDSAGNPVPVPRWDGRILSHNSTLFDIFPESPPEGRRKRQRHKFSGNFLLPRVIHIVHRVFHRRESVNFQRFPTPRKSYPRPFLPFFPPFSHLFFLYIISRLPQVLRFFREFPLDKRLFAPHSAARVKKASPGPLHFLDRQ